MDVQTADFSQADSAQDGSHCGAEWNRVHHAEGYSRATLERSPKPSRSMAAVFRRGRGGWNRSAECFNTPRGSVQITCRARNVSELVATIRFLSLSKILFRHAPVSSSSSILVATEFNRMSQPSARCSTILLY